MKEWPFAILLTAVIAVVAGCNGAYNARRSGSARPVSVQRVSWPEAKLLIRTCKAKAVEQTHRNRVTVTLRSGRKVFTQEPHIDLVVHEVVRVNGQTKCPPITLAME